MNTRWIKGLFRKTPKEMYADEIIKKTVKGELKWTLAKDYVHGNGFYNTYVSNDGDLFTEYLYAGLGMSYNISPKDVHLSDHLKPLHLLPKKTGKKILDLIGQSHYITH